MKPPKTCIHVKNVHVHVVLVNQHPTPHSQCSSVTGELVMMVRGGKSEGRGFCCYHGHDDEMKETGDLRVVAGETCVCMREGGREEGERGREGGGGREGGREG